MNTDDEGIAVFADRILDVRLPGPAYTLSGVLRDPRGAPVGGVSISSIGPTEAATVTAADGSFALRLLEGEYRLQLDTVFGPRPAGMPRGIVDVWSGTLTADRDEAIEAPWAWVTGRVQESAGDVIADTALAFNGGCFACSQSATTGPDGRYEAIVYQAVYRVEVTPPAPRPVLTIEDVDCTSTDVTLNVDY